MQQPEINPSPEGLEKQRRWDKLAAEIEAIVDGLGKPVDPGVKETLIALKASEINSTQSCEGHLYRGIAAPWVDIADQEAVEMSKNVDWSKELTDEREIEERKTIRSVIERKNLELCRKAIEQLTDFYQARSIPFDRRLTLQGRALGSARLESQGATIQKIADEETRKRKLAEYQEEMKAFTEFLKGKYFRTE
jgi:hypothetical protein